MECNFPSSFVVLYHIIILSPYQTWIVWQLWHHACELGEKQSLTGEFCPFRGANQYHIEAGLLIQPPRIRILTALPMLLKLPPKEKPSYILWNNSLVGIEPISYLEFWQEKHPKESCFQRSLQIPFWAHCINWLNPLEFGISFWLYELGGFIFQVFIRFDFAGMKPFVNFRF